MICAMPFECRTNGAITECRGIKTRCAYALHVSGLAGSFPLSVPYPVTLLKLEPVSAMLGDSYRTTGSGAIERFLVNTDSGAIDSEKD